MTEVLSKEEVEALLSAVSSGKVSKKKEREGILPKTGVPYDFKRPNRISKDQVRTLELLHESFIHSYTVKLANYLRTMVEVSLIAVDQLSYAEFIASLCDPTYMVIFNVEPVKCQILLEISPSFSFSIIDRLLGGSGKALKEARELTSIEHSIMEKVVILASGCLEQAWKRIASLSFKVQGKESNPHFVQIAPAGETTVLITMKAKVGESLGIMNICIPYTVVESILPRLSSNEWASVAGREVRESSPKLAGENLDRIKLEVAVKLGAVTISIRDFLQIGVGDVVGLEQGIHQDLVVKVEGCPKFLAKPGRVGRRRAVQIVSKIRKGEN